MMYGYDMTGWGWAVMILGMAGLFALLFVVVWLVARPQRPSPSPHELLDARLVRGEIDVDEHARLLEALHGRAPAPR
jgi:hypothetical protein